MGLQLFMIYFIPTPLGNIEDLTKRAIKYIKTCDIIFCEDTRVTKRLLNIIKERFDVEISPKEFISMHSHNEKKVLQNLNKSIFDKTVVYMSDAGMPCISDPGVFLVKYAQENHIEYEVLPGANAAITAYASSGFTEKEFLFYGFLPNKGFERKSAIDEILNAPYNTIVYEAPHRIMKFVDEIAMLDPARELFAQKEISKLYQKWYKNSAEELKKIFINENLKGEWVVVIKGKHSIRKFITKEDILQTDMAPKQKAKLLSKITDKSTKEWYEAICNVG